MNVLKNAGNAEKNLLPQGGSAMYFGKVINSYDADIYFDQLMQTIQWKNDTAFIFGKHFTTKRKVAWYADRPFSYTYSNTTKEALTWTKELLELKNLTEASTNATFNSCLLNLYHDGKEGMAWHSDDEKTLGRDLPIASLSFGAERKFSFKHKETKELVSQVLEHGSLLLMKGDIQKNWWHRLPPSKKVLLPRINLTFRTMLVS